MKVDLSKDTHPYIIFLERSKISCTCGIHWRKNKRIRAIREAFGKKGISVCVLENLLDISNYHYNNLPVFFDDLEYPQFGRLYILFDTCNFDTVKVIKYYNTDLHFFKMKSYTHNFLIFLAQSLGACEISWSCSINKANNKASQVSGEISSGGDSHSLSASKSSEKDDRVEMSNNLTLRYDNNGSQLFFATMNRNMSWGVKLNKIFSDNTRTSASLRPCPSVPKQVEVEDIKYWRNKAFLKHYLRNNKVFRYEFYRKNDFLVDFVRKRQYRMTRVNQEMVFFDTHQTINKYYMDLGGKYLGNLGLGFSNSQSESNYDKTVYNVIFYQTRDLESKTLEDLILNKSIREMKLEDQLIIKQICNKFELDQEYQEDQQLFHLFVILNRYKSYFRFKAAEEEEKHRKNLEISDGTRFDDNNDNNVNDNDKARNDNDEESTKVDNYEDDSTDEDPQIAQNTSRGLNIIKIEKIRFVSQLLHQFQEEIQIPKDHIQFYLAKTSDDFIYYTINYILEAIDLEKAMRDFISNISTLTSLIPRNDNFAEIQFIRESHLFSAQNKLLVRMCSRLPRYKEFINILKHDKEETLKSEYEKITKVELISKEDGGNYANCNGVYKMDSDKLVNGKPVFVNPDKERFIGRCGSGWVLTGCQWLNDIVKESANKSNSFGGFHSSLNGEVPIAMSTWKDYDVRIIRSEII